MDKRKIKWMIFSLGIAAVSIWMVIKQSESFSLKFLMAHIKNANNGWLLMAFLCMFGFIWFEGTAIVRIANALGIHRKCQQGTVYGAADVYFSAITPSASGGQPASAYFMMRDGMSGPVTTIILLLNLIMYSAALLVVGLVTFFIYGRMLFELSIASKLLFGVGAVIMIGLGLIFYLLLSKGDILYGICDRFLRALEKIKLVKHGQRRRDKLYASMEHYKECAGIIANDKRMLAEAFLLNVLQRISQLAVTFMVFMACGRGARASLEAMAMQCFVAVGSNSMPVPGAMGVADYIMLDGFRYLVGSGDAVTMELMCRGITFYGCVLTGGMITILGYVRGRKKRL